MKTRQGFVSNSSSSSFCILGICADSIKYSYEKLHEILEKPLSFSYGISDYSQDTVIIGIAPQCLNEEKTIRETKEWLLKELRRIGFKVEMKDLSWHTDGGFDG